MNELAVQDRAVWEAVGLEVRQLDDGAPVIAGYAAVFNSWSALMVNERGRQFRERIAPGAFDRTLANGTDIRALWNHNADYPLGRTANGTLSIRKDGNGLRFELRPDMGTSWGASAVAAIRRGDVNAMSFAFSAAREGGDMWEKPGADGVAMRTLLDADLFEVSPVTFPAYPQTSATVRSMPEFEPETGIESDGQEADEIERREAEQRALRLRAKVERELMNWGRV